MLVRKNPPADGVIIFTRVGIVIFTRIFWAKIILKFTRTHPSLAKGVRTRTLVLQNYSKHHGGMIRTVLKRGGVK